MAEMGPGYGSEAHLLRYLGRHQNLLNSEILDLIPAASIRWLDFGFDRNKKWSDTEIVRLDFLPEEAPARQQWSSVWPMSGTPINWDAVAELQTEHGPEWLLVIYFCGDQDGPGRSCPATPAMWEEALSMQARHLGLPSQHPLSDRIHRLFLEVCPN